MSMENAPKDGRRILILTYTYGWDFALNRNTCSGTKWVEAWWAKGMGLDEYGWQEWCGNERTRTTGRIEPITWARLPVLEG
jgi:hypothetical protein